MCLRTELVCGRIYIVPWRTLFLKGKRIKHRGNRQPWCSRYVGIFCTANYKKKPQIPWYSDWLNLDRSSVVGKRGCEKPKGESESSQVCWEHCTELCCAGISRRPLCPREASVPQSCICRQQPRSLEGLVVKGRDLIVRNHTKTSGCRLNAAGFRLKRD